MQHLQKNRGEAVSGTRHSASSHNLVSAALPRVTEHGSQGTGHGLCFSLPRYLVTSLLPYLPARLTCLLLHCSTHGSPTTRPTLSYLSPLARSDFASHPRFAALHRSAPARRPALLARNCFSTRCNAPAPSRHRPPCTRRR